jgi:hypothetical protein
MMARMLLVLQLTADGFKNLTGCWAAAAEIGAGRAWRTLADAEKVWPAW